MHHPTEFKLRQHFVSDCLRLSQIVVVSSYCVPCWPPKKTHVRVPRNSETGFMWYLWMIRQYAQIECKVILGRRVPRFGSFEVKGMHLGIVGLQIPSLMTAAQFLQPTYRDFKSHRFRCIRDAILPFQHQPHPAEGHQKALSNHWPSMCCHQWDPRTTSRCGRGGASFTPSSKRIRGMSHLIFLFWFWFWFWF